MKAEAPNLTNPFQAFKILDRSEMNFKMVEEDVV